jgi:Fe2+ or Zn2+ uptake regulation protein
MSDDFTEHVARDRRLVILRALHMDHDYRLNESVLQTVLDDFGHSVSRDRVRSDLDWLKEQGLVKTELVANRIVVATLTQAGADVATGRAQNHGVNRPSPRG